MKTIKKVLFLNPPDPTVANAPNNPGYAYFEPPIGLLYIYSYLKNTQKYNVSFCDMNIEMKFLSKKNLEDTIKDLMELNKPDLVAVSALYYTSREIFHNISKKIKEIDSSTIVVLGGHYPTHITNLALADKNVDFAILSEGEEGMADLIEALNTSSGLENVEGIAYVKDGKIIKNDRRRFWQGFLNSKRLPWEDINMEHYFKEGKSFLYRVFDKNTIKLGSMTATRGCPNQCTFCSSPKFFKHVWRFREIESIVDEIKFLKENYGVNTIIFNDENMTVYKDWFLKLMDEFKKLNVRWVVGGGLSVRTINNEEIIKKMIESGIAIFNIAIESGNEETLKKVKKPLTLPEVENVVRLIRKYGKGYIIGFFIVGFPFETKKDFLDTLEFGGKLDVDWRAYYCFQPFPGIELYDYCLKNNLMKEYDEEKCANYEFHSAAEIKYAGYTSEELSRLNYLYNLKYNFLENRNLLLGTEESLNQAERDFNYVLELAPMHFFSNYCLAEVMRKRNDESKRKEYLKKAKDILENDKSFDWSYYLKELGINTKTLLGTANKIPLKINTKTLI
ncbi:MAG: B12-binding domain-containing radical SAM protein [Candidatus Staskawiczbacteria bacterium]|nr:B12-binding domain-containing radical SAM protein [Candidatus Staskawiczbacteria bacterium]